MFFLTSGILKNKQQRKKVTREKKDLGNRKRNSRSGERRLV
jgi:hypothetical protein